MFDAGRKRDLLLAAQGAHRLPIPSDGLLREDVVEPATPGRRDGLIELNHPWSAADRPEMISCQVDHHAA